MKHRTQEDSKLARKKMPYMVISWCQKGGSTTISDGRRAGVAPSSVSRRGGSPGSGIERFVRKLKKRSKMLYMASRPPTFHCQYDPLSYARNFDRNGFGCASDDDPALFCHTFSSRFAMASSSMQRETASSH
ncbi:hypothetical protein J5N97_017870 [Dioscorea zingiberensis]|uniref:Uncharacterized protein n=1 Tax=Dioscorea zingiberensis TaxID=325984 RepID=A0A9D5CMD5_9LILI|nr:hypothetical protein J5N97_017870 [Dioscorea zingiberensis]